MTTVAKDPHAVHRALCISTAASPSKGAALGLSPISTLTETPRKLKKDPSNSDNNNAHDEANTRVASKRSDSWTSRAGFSPRPKRSNNPARRPVESASSICALRSTDERSGDMLRDLSNQCQLERIQEADDSDDETENDTQDDDEEEDDEYDGDGEEDDALQLYKSFSGDLLRYNSVARSHRAFDEEDDMVRI